MNWQLAANGYRNLWRKAAFASEKYRSRSIAVAKKLLEFRSSYDAIESQTGIPWWFVGIIHSLESGFSFSTHLHNGDSLSARTIHRPAGRPLSSPPFTWIESALDALKLKELHLEKDWSFPKALWNFERYNGFGYVQHKVNSPYLWSFTNLYSKGKYVRDGVWDSEAVSSQCGAAAILLALIELGALQKEKELVMSNVTMQDALPIIEKLAPVGASVLASPLYSFALSALARVLSCEPDEGSVASKVLSLPLRELNAVLDMWEAAIEPLSDKATPSVPAPTNPVSTPVVSPIDAIFGFTGWKTVIGIVLYVVISAGAFFFPAVLTADIVSILQTIVTGLIGVGLAAKLDRFLVFLKK